MKKLLLLPTMLFPYMVCLCLGYGFIAHGWSDAIFIIFGVIALIVLALSFVCNIVYIVLTRKSPAEELLKTALLIKLIHIPTYILIFLVGIIMALTFWMTLPFILLFIVVDLLTLLMSGMISIYSLITALRCEGLCSKKLLGIALACQFFYCADIISLLVVKGAIKKKKLS